MKACNRKFRMGLAALALVGVGLAGCESTPAATPISQRKAGEDISPQDRVDKRGDVPGAGAPAANASATPGSTDPPPAEPPASSSKETPPADPPSPEGK